MRIRPGFTLIEVLIALVILGTVFVVLVNSQITSLQVASRARLSSEVKAAAVRQMEQIGADIVRLYGSGTTRFYYFKYYFACPNTSGVTIPTGVPSPAFACTNTTGNITWEIRPLSAVQTAYQPYAKEGIVNVKITVADPKGVRVVYSQNYSCYDVSPSPTFNNTDTCDAPVGPTP